MIEVHLLGHLGNQMFQYACGRALSSKLNQELCLNESSLFVNNQKYQLGVFGITAKLINETSKNKLKLSVWDKIHQRFSRIKGLTTIGQINFVNERDYCSYDHRIQNISNNSILIGYWQSEKYFEDIQKLIEKDFEFRKPLTNKNKQILERINNSNSVSIHIRRAEYLIPKHFNNHGICKLKYYESSFQEIERNVKNPMYFVFSDDLEWTKKNLHYLKNAEIIYGNVDEDSYIDMQLMSSCKHNIIANSTFSWWAAWLNKNDDKIVIAPKQWYVNKYRNKNKNEIIPNNWIKL